MPADLSDDVKSRLFSFDFESALFYLNGSWDESKPTDQERALIESLARAIGNSDCLVGDLGVIVEAATYSLIGDMHE